MASTVGEALAQAERHASQGEFAQAAGLLEQVLAATSDDRSAQVQLGLRLAELALDAGAVELAFTVAERVYGFAGPVTPESIATEDVADAVNFYLLTAAAAGRSSDYDRVLTESVAAAVTACRQNWLVVWRIIGIAAWDAKVGSRVGRSSGDTEALYDRARAELAGSPAADLLAACRASAGHDDAEAQAHLDHLIATVTEV
jgi:hypothetical protein